MWAPDPAGRQIVGGTIYAATPPFPHLRLALSFRYQLHYSLGNRCQNSEWVDRHAVVRCILRMKFQ
jgi:hypothetical protein